MKRKRKSLFGLSVNEEVVKNQNKHFPRCMKLVIFSMSFIFPLRQMLYWTIKFPENFAGLQILNLMLKSKI